VKSKKHDSVSLPRNYQYSFFLIYSDTDSIRNLKYSLQGKKPDESGNYKRTLQLRKFKGTKYT
jgi:hypothetical protein